MDKRAISLKVILTRWIDRFVQIFAYILFVAFLAVSIVLCKRRKRTKRSIATARSPIPPTPAHKAIPPPTVPVSKARVDDDTMREVESLKQDKHSIEQ
jgi:hypothetical protein